MNSPVYVLFGIDSRNQATVLKVFYRELEAILEKDLCNVQAEIDYIIGLTGKQDFYRAIQQGVKRTLPECYKFEFTDYVIQESIIK